MLTQNRQFQWMSIGSYIYPVVPAYAATLLKQSGYDVIWYDGIAEQHTQDQFLLLLEKESPDLVVMETKTPVVKLHWDIITEIKRVCPKTKTVLMGDHVTALPEESLNFSKVDYVLTGGEIPAMAVVDAVVRLIPGVVGNNESIKDESFSERSLEYPQYTRPEKYKEMKVPSVLLSGNHARILKWRQEQAKKRTKQRRADLLKP